MSTGTLRRVGTAYTGEASVSHGTLLRVFSFTLLWWTSLIVIIIKVRAFCHCDTRYSILKNNLIGFMIFISELSVV